MPLTPQEVKRIKYRLWYHSNPQARRAYRKKHKARLAAINKKSRNKIISVVDCDGNVTQMTRRQYMNRKRWKKLSEERKKYYYKNQLQFQIYNQLRNLCKNDTLSQ